MPYSFNLLLARLDSDKLIKYNSHDKSASFTLIYRKDRNGPDAAIQT